MVLIKHAQDIKSHLTATQLELAPVFEKTTGTSKPSFGLEQWFWPWNFPMEAILAQSLDFIVERWTQTFIESSEP